MTTLDLLGRDVLDAARELLEPGEQHLVVGVEMSDRPRVALLEQAADGATVGRSHRPADLGDDELLTASHHLVVALLNQLPELQRVVIGKAMSDGARLRVHARPETGEIAIGLLHASGNLVHIAQRTISPAAAIV